MLPSFTFRSLLFEFKANSVATLACFPCELMRGQGQRNPLLPAAVNGHQSDGQAAIFCSFRKKGSVQLYFLFYFSILMHVHCVHVTS